MSNLMMQSRVLLYGRVLQGVTINTAVFDAGTGGLPGLGNNRFLREQFNDSGYNLPAPPDPAIEPCFATIYGFEFEAHFYDLAIPTILLVHGPGVAHTDNSICRVEPPDEPELEVDIRVWPYDKADFSMRLDIDSGPLESILIEVEFDDSEMTAESSGRHVSGRHVSGRHMSGRHMSGRHVRGKKS